VTDQLRPHEKPNAGPRLRCGLLVLPLLLMACTKDEATDYCKNHYRFHSQHIGKVARLRIELDVDGILSSELELPLAAIGSNSPDLASETTGLMGLLEDPGKVYSIQSLGSCETPTVNFGNKSSPAGNSLLAEYRSQCGNGNQVKQVDINLFEELPWLDEIETNVFTPATTKRFAISRQCDSAIFRLDPRAEDK